MSDDVLKYVLSDLEERLINLKSRDDYRLGEIHTDIAVDIAIIRAAIAIQETTNKLLPVMETLNGILISKSTRQGNDGQEDMQE
jgi:hypothetical protein